MERPAAAPPEMMFKDGLGERYLAVNAADERVEVLALSRELTSVPSVESAVREQVARLASFHDDAHARVRGVLQISELSTLAIAADLVVGIRLFDLLTTAQARRVPVDLNAALCLIRQLVAAVARLHGGPTDFWHGAIGPERLVIARTGRLVVVDHGLATALERLRFSRERYWRELRVALPQTGGLPRFDRRSDVNQIGTVALALILGRPLGDEEYPSRIAETLDGAVAAAAAGTTGPLPAQLRLWVSRALQLDPGHAFASAVDAKADLTALVGEPAGNTEENALAAFIAKCLSSGPNQATPSSPRTRTASDAEAASPTALADRESDSATRDPWLGKPEPGLRPPALELRDSAAAGDIGLPPLVEPVALAAADSVWPAGVAAPEAVGVPVPRAWRPSRKMIAAAAVLVALAAGATFAARQFFRPTTAGQSVGTLVVTTNPPGLPVLVDDEDRGTTPVTVSLPPGAHTLQVVTEGGVRRIPVTIVAGSQVAQFLELPQVAAAQVGQLRVRTEPPGARVTVDGRFSGTSPVTVEGLTPGTHAVVLESELGSLREQVTIQAGATASLVVPIRAPQGVPVSGWISVSAPMDVQVFENDRLLGSSRSDRIMVSAGRHELEIVNESVGYRATRTVQVTAGKVSPISLEWPSGTLSINAIPWANVWIDDQPAGETPIGSVLLPIGQHTIVFRHPELGERRATATVTLQAPAKVSVDLRKR